MKREIKFRAWDGEKMVGVAELRLNTKELLVDDEELLSMCYSPLMQFTGLKDKNGREIYEGDIVRWGDMVGFGHEKPVRVAVVRFDPDICFDSNVGIFDYGNFAYEETDKYLTVIGNIHDNPELLEAYK